MFFSNRCAGQAEHSEQSAGQQAGNPGDQRIASQQFVTGSLARGGHLAVIVTGIWSSPSHLPEAGGSCSTNQIGSAAVRIQAAALSDSRQ